jgi:hypothetical protein
MFKLLMFFLVRSQKDKGLDSKCHRARRFCTALDTKRILDWLHPKSSITSDLVTFSFTEVLDDISHLLKTLTDLLTVP